MRARDIFERYAAAPAPVEAPPKPDVKPGPAERPAPTKHPNPFRRRRTPGIDPGPMPKPKACVEAKDLFRVKLGRFTRDDAIKVGRAKPLEDYLPNAKPGEGAAKAAGAAKAVRAKETAPTPKAREMFLGMSQGRVKKPSRTESVSASDLTHVRAHRAAKFRGRAAGGMPSEEHARIKPSAKALVTSAVGRFPSEHGPRRKRPLHP